MHLFHVLLGPALLVLQLTTPAFAQHNEKKTPTAQETSEETTATDAQSSFHSHEVEKLRREFEEKLEAARHEVKQLREKIHAQTAPKQTGWQEVWAKEKRKLELFTIDGYLRVRPEFFFSFDLGRGEDKAGYYLWGRPTSSERESANLGTNMRFRFEPTLNISEEIRIHTQIDALDNLLWGSTPDYAFSRNAANNYWYDRNEFSVFSFSQAPQRSGINSLQDAITLKRVWGEVSTPIGILRFGRMGNHWGLGMLYNDGNGLDNDWGDTVDRISFTVEPLSGFYITPMLDWNVEGLSSTRLPEGGQPYDLSNSDDANSYILVIARRDTASERLAKLHNQQTVFNYGLHFTYRVQQYDPVDYLSQPFAADDASKSKVKVQRNAQLFITDLWAQVERKNFRIEAEFAAILGSIQNRALSGADALSPALSQALYIYQLGATLQGEYRFFDGDLKLTGEIGIASGDKAPGFGNYPRRKGSGTAGSTAPGDYDGPQYQCVDANGCADDELTHFRFNRDYRIDMILYREILGNVTDSLYIKPKVQYTIIRGLDVFISLIWSRAIFFESTPGGALDNDANLGVELNLGARFETEDGFFIQLRYGALFPLGGFSKRDATNAPVSLETAQALRALAGIRF